MKLDHVDLYAEPFFRDASCPKGHGDMIQLNNGWFSVCWYCKKCKFPYQLRMMKMLNVHQENLNKLLAEKNINPND